MNKFKFSHIFRTQKSFQNLHLKEFSPNKP
jgi:hypothetical protein